MAEQTASLTQRLLQKSLHLGFERFGACAIEDVPELKHYLKWIEKGYAADMNYLKRNLDKRMNPKFLLENARSVIVCAKNYHTQAPLSIDSAPETSGWISRYAWGDDYHDSLKLKIRQLYEYLLEITGGKAAGRYYVDTGPVLEKVWAKYAGLGWIGKNTCLINQTLGSFVFLAVIITDVELTYGTPPPDRCGTCTRCIDACPTNAILAPYLLDAGLCISYLTIERREEIPEHLREPMGRQIFGCDICQDVCPWNRKAPFSLEESFQPRAGAVNPDLSGVLSLDQQTFSEKFRKSPVKRTKLKGLLRNALIAAGNSGSVKLLPAVKRFLNHPDLMLREHAQWAYDRLIKTQ